MSSRGRTIRSLAVWMVKDRSFCSRMMPETRRPSVVATLVSGVFAGDGCAGVEDVLEDVVGIGPVGAGEIGADVAAAVEEPVALMAGAVEDEPASARVSGGGLVRGQELLVLGDQRAFSFEVGRTEPQTASRRVRTFASPRASNWRAIVAFRSRRGTTLLATASSRARAQAGRADSVAMASSRSDSVSCADSVSGSPAAWPASL